jgi:hypothetical protein
MVFGRFGVQTRAGAPTIQTGLECYFPISRCLCGNSRASPQLKPGQTSCWLSYWQCRYRGLVCGVRWLMNCDGCGRMRPWHNWRGSFLCLRMTTGGGGFGSPVCGLTWLSNMKQERSPFDCCLSFLGLPDSLILAVVLVFFSNKIRTFNNIYIGLWRWYINVTIPILDIIHLPVFSTL